MEDFVQDAEQNVLDRFRQDWLECVRNGSPVVVQILIGAVLCGNGIDSDLSMS